MNVFLFNLCLVINIHVFVFTGSASIWNSTRIDRFVSPHLTQRPTGQNSIQCRNRIGRSTGINFKYFYYLQTFQMQQRYLKLGIELVDYKIICFLKKLFEIL